LADTEVIAAVDGWLREKIEKSQKSSRPTGLVSRLFNVYRELKHSRRLFPRVEAVFQTAARKE
jgi:hypothetical protein